MTISKRAQVFVFPGMMYTFLVTDGLGTTHYAVYWKNGQEVIVGDSASISSGIAIDGSDVYVSGCETTINGTTSFTPG